MKYTIQLLGYPHKNGNPKINHRCSTGKYGPTYLVLDLLQKIFYTSDAARESFVELCEEEYVQKVARRAIFLVVFMVEWNMATMATMATTEAFRVWKTWNWNSPFQFVMISCIRIAVQVTFDSYLYKTVQGNDPVGDLKLGWKTLSSLYKYKNQKTPDPMRTLT